MLFSKPKMPFLEFAAEFFTGIIGMERTTFEAYLSVDAECVLSEDEFKEFNNRELEMMLLFGSIQITEKVNLGEIQFRDERDFQKQIHEAMFWGFKNNNYSNDEMMVKLESFENLAEGFNIHWIKVRNIDKNKLNQAAIFCGKHYLKKDDQYKNITYNMLVKCDLDAISKYFISGYKKVKIVTN